LFQLIGPDQAVSFPPSCGSERPLSMQTVGITQPHLFPTYFDPKDERTMFLWNSGILYKTTRCQPKRPHSEHKQPRRPENLRKALNLLVNFICFFSSLIWKGLKNIIFTEFHTPVMVIWMKDINCNKYKSNETSGNVMFGVSVTSIRA
jgi:hypothetical protein